VARDECTFNESDDDQIKCQWLSSSFSIGLRVMEYETGQFEMSSAV